MNQERVLAITKELRLLDADIERVKDGLKTLKEKRDEKEVELRAEIEHDDKQEELKFDGSEKPGATEAEYEDLSTKGPKQLEEGRPLSLPANPGVL